MKSALSVFFALILFSTNEVAAQTADELVEKHITAIGGKETISKIKTMITESDLSVMGSALSSVSTVVVGVGFKNVAEFNGQEIIQCITPTGGWMINPLQGMLDPSALPEDQVKAAQGALEVGSELYEYKAKGSTVELEGRENIGGVSTYKIKLTKKGGNVIHYFIDPATYYVVKTESMVETPGQQTKMTSVFSNYQRTPFGYVMPYTTVRDQGFEMTITVKSVQFNTEVDPKIFVMPK